MSYAFPKKQKTLLEVLSPFAILNFKLSFRKGLIYIMKEAVQLCYTISEAAKLMNVEPHVLRYWEDELNLTIARNSMGHRIYTDDDLKTFKSIQHLKSNHISLKDIRAQLPAAAAPPSAVYSSGGEMAKTSDVSSSGDKMTQFKAILTNIIKDAMSENSKQISDDVSSKVSSNVRKEIDFLIRQQEEAEEARFKELDETIRTFQKARQEAAVTKTNENKGKKSRFFKKHQ